MRASVFQDALSCKRIINKSFQIGVTCDQNAEIPRSTLLAGLFAALCSVKRTTLLPVGNALCIERTADDVITHTRQVAHSSAANQDNGVLLQIVPDSRNIADSLHPIGEFHLGNLTESGVRLFRRGRINLGANASLLRRAEICLLLRKGVEAFLQNRRLRLVLLFLTAIANELIECWHVKPPFSRF